ncbi:hypothetical protein DENIT_11030 [Pseudomonas veronii]|nr:hypothetical protein DENIT_11030 [Pseudomonas veronii]
MDLQGTIMDDIEAVLGALADCNNKNATE